MGLHRTILIAEDEKLFADVYTQMMKNFRPECSIITVGNGVQAIREMEKKHIDILVMGLKMPRIDGFGILRYMLDNKILLPTVIITAMWYCFRELFHPSGNVMKDGRTCRSNEYRVLKQYRPLIFGYLPSPVHVQEFQNAIIRCEEFQRHCTGGQSAQSWQDSKHFDGF